MTTFGDQVFQYGGVPVPSGGNEMITGNVFFVHSGTGTNANTGKKPSQALATIAGALTKATANNGDVIYVMEGHAESITSATTLGFSVAGVKIIGLGKGSRRPTLTFTTADTATIAVSAANVMVQNIRFVGNFLSIASAITVGAAPNFIVDSCEFSDTSAILGFLTAVTTTVTVNADNFTYTNNSRVSIATTSPGPDIVVAGTMSGLTVTDNSTTHLVASNNVAALVEHGALVMTNARVLRNFVYSVNTDTSSGAILVKTTATTGSGMVAGNRIRALDIAAAIVVTAAAVQYGLFDNLYIGDGTSNSGFVLPAIGSDA